MRRDPAFEARLVEVADDRGVQFARDFFGFFADVMGLNYHVGEVELSCGVNIVESSVEFGQRFFSAVFGQPDLIEDMLAQQKKNGVCAGGEASPGVAD